MISAGYKSAYQQGYSDAMRDFRKSADKTQMVDKSNFDMAQYKADLETARDCEKAKWLKCIEDIKAEIYRKFWLAKDLYDVIVGLIVVVITIVLVIIAQHIEDKKR